jgi:hypothetical protein
VKTYVKRLMIAAALVSSVGYPAQRARAGGGEWWVVLGSIPTPDNNFTPQVEASVGRIEAIAGAAVSSRFTTSRASSAALRRGGRCRLARLESEC